MAPLFDRRCDVVLLQRVQLERPDAGLFIGQGLEADLIDIGRIDLGALFGQCNGRCPANARRCGCYKRRLAFDSRDHVCISPPHIKVSGEVADIGR